MSTPEPPAPHLPPVPRYGEYAAATGPVQPPAQPLQPYGEPNYYQQPFGPRPLRVGDMIASIILLTVGLLSVLFTVLNALLLTSQMQIIYDDYGVDAAYEPGAGQAIASAVIIISHVVLWGVAVAITLPLIRKRRLSFWVPLTAGAVAAVVYFVTLVVLIVTDGPLFAVLMEQSQR